MSYEDMEKVADKQKRDRGQSLEGTEKRNLPREESDRDAWSAVNDMHQGEREDGNAHPDPRAHEPRRPDEIKR